MENQSKERNFTFFARFAAAYSFFAEQMYSFILKQ